MSNQLHGLYGYDLNEGKLLILSMVGSTNKRYCCSCVRLWKMSFVGFHMARDEGRPLATSSPAVGRFAGKQASPRSPWGRLVASLLLCLQYDSLHLLGLGSRALKILAKVAQAIP